MNFIESLIQNPYFQNIFSGAIGGLIVWVVQNISDRKRKNKEDLEKSIVGKKNLKILSQDFYISMNLEKLQLKN